MPLIQVHLDRGLYEQHHEEIGHAIHQAQVAALGIPADDRFQVFSPHEPGELKFDPAYNDVDRRQLLLIRVIAVQMYATAVKQSFFRAVIERLLPLGIRAEDVLICLTENAAHDWYAGRI